jgi:hypothetical protein
MTRPSPDIARIFADQRAAQIQRANELIDRDLVLRLRLATLDAQQGRLPGLTVAEALGADT